MQPPNTPAGPQPHPRRPFLITLLAAGFAFCGLAGILRFYATLHNWDLLVELGVQPGPPYFLLGGLLWGLLGLASGLALYTGWRFAARLAVLSLSFLLISYWLDRYLASRLGTLPPNGIFAAAVSAASVGFTALALALPGSRRFLNRFMQRE